ncbi:uncharacterized protein APUU_60151A [Aspergillus puulaauensis]|uniref:GPI anchored protein n=1 Tax=Aspergillus puulaauensis TaxID=1220207 RepID=A0A7R7XUG2_9EURO|nr:uncharacterized protein APUU_60151A [Aspergillus puulaauensis]BCS27103.1 hypothetical protein APUU_60151A [Aspergillus puulaauensis]
MPIPVLLLLSVLPLSTAQCPNPTETLAVEWPDSLYRNLEILVSEIDSSSDITTYEAVSCPGNPGMTLAFGPRTFSLQRAGSNQAGHSLIDECQPLGSGMTCTHLEEGGMENTITTTYGSDEIYTVSIAVVSSGDSNTAPPTLTAPPYVGCPDTWQQCGDEPWCCPTTATICTTAPNSHEACASVANEEFPGPALPYIASTMTAGPVGDGGGSEDGAGLFAAQPTGLLLGGLAGLGFALF